MSSPFPLHRPGLRCFLVLALATSPLLAQLAPTPGTTAVYRVPPKAVLDILDAPLPPFATVSSNKKWVTTTERDLNHVTIAELAEPMLSLAGSRFKQYPDARLENIGITKITFQSIDGGTGRTLVPPGDGRILSTATVRDSATDGELAYAAILQGAMSVHLYDASTGVDRLVATPGLTGKIAGLTFTRDGRCLA